MTVEVTNPPITAIAIGERSEAPSPKPNVFGRRARSVVSVVLAVTVIVAVVSAVTVATAASTVIVRAASTVRAVPSVVLRAASGPTPIVPLLPQPPLRKEEPTNVNA